MQSVELLGELGFEEFSLNKVIKKAGLTKGAFFHYFDSKKELLDGIIDLLLVPMTEEFNNIADDASLEPKAKIIKMLKTGYVIKGTETRTTQQLIMLLKKPENRIISQMITSRIVDECVPIYEKVFIEGNEKGQFSIEQPNGAAYLFLNMIVAVNKEIGRVSYKREVDPIQFGKLKSKVLAFELYAKGLFNFDKEIDLYSEDMLKVDLK